MLNVNPQFVVRLRGLKDDESGTILQYLYDRAKIPEYQLRVRWEPHTVVMWDNRAVQHYAPHDYYPQRRTMERVTIAGDAVVGVSGPYTPEAGVEPLPDGKGQKAGPCRQGADARIRTLMENGWPTPEAACGRLPLEGATPADRQSRIRGVRLKCCKAERRADRHHTMTST